MCMKCEYYLNVGRQGLNVYRSLPAGDDGDAGWRSPGTALVHTEGVDFCLRKQIEIEINLITVCMLTRLKE